MMDGKQKTVALGLRYMAERVESGTYGDDDEAFGGVDASDGSLCGRSGKGGRPGDGRTGDGDRAGGEGRA